jgi:hypothetical protein
MTLRPVTETGYSVFGATGFYPFSVTISVPQSFDEFVITADGTELHNFKVQTEAFVVPSLSTAVTSTSTFVNVTVAVSSHKERARRYLDKGFNEVNVSAPVPQQGTLAPKVQTWTVPMSPSAELGMYKLWIGSIDLRARITGAVTTDIVSKGEITDKAVL